MSVIFETSLGDLTIDLFLSEAPKSTENFLKLCKLKYYDHCLFFDIQKDFTVQCGDPTNTGKGGMSVWGILKGDQYRYLKDEISEKRKHDRKGLVAMATTGKDSIGSQFYITTSALLSRLDGKYTIIGEVVEGLETLDKINQAVVDLSGRPVQVLRIQHTIVLEDPYPDPPGLKCPDRSPSPPRHWPHGMLPEDLDDLEETEESRRAFLAEEAAKAKAEALVLMGELPDVDVRPPDNVLFVCKLNPTTTGKSLAVIFSRFGRVVESEVIHDRHGNSLCYAFVAFSETESTEEAYLKMQNVLIDGRRIHVDFCQSVSKVENFRAAGGWKRFFADRAKGFNADAPASLEFKRSSNAPLSFSASSRRDQHRPSDYHDQRERNGEGHQQPSVRSYGQQRPHDRESSHHPHRRDYQRDGRRDEYSSRSSSDYRRDDRNRSHSQYRLEDSHQTSSTQRDEYYPNGRDYHERDGPSLPDASYRKRQHSPPRDQDISKKPKYS